jgi:hypothetical protein
MKASRLFWLAISLLTASLAHADDDRGHSGASLLLLPKYQQECAACHLAYPPGMLPAASWQRLMTNLPKHFGTDASLDSASVAELNRWLVTNAGTYKRVGSEPPPADRITRSAWFIRKHDEVAAATWQRASIKSAANCAACHSQADKGDFNEHRVRIPK